jgi:hypothetical protein
MSLDSTALFTALKAISIFVGASAATFAASSCALMAFNNLTDDQNKEDDYIFNFKALYFVSGISLVSGILSAYLSHRSI